MRRSVMALLLVGGLVAAGCAAVQPALKTLALAFGQDLIASASVNYTPRYAEHVESLLVALARKGTGLALEPQLAEAGYRPPPRDYEAGARAGYQGYEAADYPDSDGYDPGYVDYDGYPGADFEGMGLDAAIIVQRSGSTTLETVEDGDVLYDGGSDPARGDLLRFYFRADRDAWVYVIGIDATGYVAQIFPDPAGTESNPVYAQREYLLPATDEWWGLDAQTGVEQVFFVASASPRNDIEQVVNGLLTQPRQLTQNQYLPVRRPAMIRTRGLVKVSGGGAPAATVPAGDTWYAPEESGELVLTRWFVHESLQ